MIHQPSNFIRLFFVLSAIFLTAEPGLCLSGKDMAALSKNGVGAETIQLLIREKTIETCAWTVKEIIEMKRSGISEKTLQALIRESAEPRPRKTIIYGEKAGPVMIRTLDEIVSLKKNGISDEVIQALLKAGSRQTRNEEREEILELLKKMGVMVDMRQ